MSSSIGRRDFFRAGIAAASAAALGQASAASDPLHSTRDQGAAETGTGLVEGKLQSKLSPEAQKLLQQSMDAVNGAAKSRLSFKLPENSEPCFVYLPAEVKRS